VRHCRRQPSGEDAEQKTSACSSFIPKNRNRCDEAAHRASTRDRDEQQ